ncbi:MAG: hypothetical protein K2M15_07290 [Oscillospiraceae bacterium]|nr:hypothetical protein [Oscillospiraceae bacterium]MDE7170574.1 hypothetical protein [Oscillospiraceae bacterium]
MDRYRGMFDQVVEQLGPGQDKVDALRGSLARRCLDGQTKEVIPMKKHPGLLRGAVAAAACLALAVCAGVYLYAGQSGPRPDTAQLPRLPLSTEVTEPNGMGFEGYLAFDSSELVNANPWTEGTKLSTLPVYRNLAPLDGAGVPKVSPDPARTRETLLETAALLGLDPGDVEIDENPELGLDFTARAEGVTIRAWEDRTVAISFDPAVSLPEGYEFGYSATYDELADAAEYLKVQYKDLIAMDDPQVNISGGDYTFYGDQMYSLEFFDAGDSLVDTMLNYNFHRAAFFGNDEGKLFIVWLYNTDLSEKVGDYPIITPDAAQKLLLEGRYITNAPYELPGEQYVKKVELLYLTGGREEYFMPYYRFLVELPQDAQENGLRCYGAYYVPAVEETYLTGLPVWDGSFN